jgi:NAD(P)-dependent dehydrogenase (short-subunit alcohol dehydrogenase family)
MILLLLAFLPAIGAAQDAQKAVLITGASTGIGRNMAETLAAEGHFVYAGARKQADLDELNAIDNIQAIRLDVTVQEEIDAAVETIKSEGRGLYGLINNAGVLVAGPLIEIDEEDLQFQMDVNVFGPYRVTKAFAPLIIESKGRISTTGSISGILSGPFFGAYSISKHAVESYTDSLAAEMAKFDVQVSIIDPGNYNSRVVESMQARMKELGRSAQGSLYEEDMQRFIDMPGDRSQYKEPDEVSAAALHAMFDDNPKRRYMVVPNERSAEITIKQMFTELVQLNEGQEYTYDREALIGMLDEALANSRH